MNEIFKDLNPPQKVAVEHINGPLLVLAGAGSGKTRVLTNRVANLIANGVDGHQILAVTFTNKAAKEMQSRIDKLLGSGESQTSGRPAIGTFHSICVRILRREIEFLDQGYNKNFVIFDTDDVKSLLKIIMKERRINDKEFKVKAIASHISSMKNLLAEPEAHFDALGMLHNSFAKVVMEIFPLYKQRMIEHNALDFDDLLQKVVEVWEYKPEILAHYQEKWPYVLVDEYQDTNFVQYRLIRLLTAKSQNLCVVGDDHQSIYSFRGADFTNILNFEHDYANAKVVKLEQNYRSTANILNNANKLIGHNESGREKNLWTEQDPGDLITIQEVFDEKNEGTYIAEQIKNFRDEGVSLSDIAILYRMNAQSRAIEEALMRHQIPYQIVGGVRFFDRREIKDIIGYLRLIFNIRDEVSFLRIINLPARKIGPATIEILKNYSNEYGLSLFDVLQHVDDIPDFSASKKLALREFRELINRLQKTAAEKPISFLLDELIEAIGFFKWLDDGTNEGEARIQNVKELFSVAGRYDVAEDSLAAFLEGVALISDVDQMQDEASVTLMTIHAAKGLEFPVVFLPGWEENIFPSTSSQFSNEQLEEERRLAYVALTRAEKNCTIVHAKQRMMFGMRDFCSPSKFISELDQECINQIGSTMRSSGFSAPTRRSVNFDHPLLQRAPKSKQEAVFGVAENETKYATGDKIKHAEFGEGTILMIAGDVISAAFKGQGVKKIVASIAPIEKI